MKIEFLYTLNELYMLELNEFVILQRKRINFKAIIPRKKLVKIFRKI